MADNPYAPAQINFAALANLPQQYQQGLQTGRENALRNAFAKGLPTGPDGVTDWNKTWGMLGSVDPGAAISGMAQAAVLNNKYNLMTPSERHSADVADATLKIAQDKAKQPDVTTQTAINNADASVNAGSDFISSMKSALELNPKAYSATTTLAPSVVPWKAAQEAITGETGGPGTASMNLENVVQNAAVQQFRTLFGPRATQNELRVLFDIKGSLTKPAAVREEIYTRAIKLAQERMAINKQQADALRNKTYYTPEQTGQTPTPSTGPVPQGGAPQQPTQAQMQLLQQHGNDPQFMAEWSKRFGQAPTQ